MKTVRLSQQGLNDFFREISSPSKCWRSIFCLNRRVKCLNRVLSSAVRGMQGPGILDAHRWGLGDARAPWRTEKKRVGLELIAAS